MHSMHCFASIMIRHWPILFVYFKYYKSMGFVLAGFEKKLISILKLKIKKA